MLFASSVQGALSQRTSSQQPQSTFEQLFYTYLPSFHVGMEGRWKLSLDSTSTWDNRWPDNQAPNAWQLYYFVYLFVSQIH